MSKNDKIHIGLQGRDPDQAFIIQPIIKSAYQARALEDTIEEAQGLAHAIMLEVVHTQIANITKIHAGSYFGKGTRSDIKDKIEETEPNIVIVNTMLTPIQQRNLEKEWNCKIIDRTGLILEIFGARAQTKEGRLQVDLAALEYQKSRLVRSWTHLERQRGGTGFMGGPGERQIELDRRIIAQQISRLKKELDDVRRTRDLGRKSRQRVPFPIISIVGYTNAGKSTLFNHITEADVFAENLPFATLDPTMRKVSLPQNQDAILADTVGFISDLPTHLVAAFRATLEQITYGDVIVHVIDVSRNDYKVQIDDVVQILESLGLDYENDPRIIEVYNKVDAADTETLEDLSRKVAACKDHSKIMLSARTGEGIEDLLQKSAAIAARDSAIYSYTLPITDGRALSWLYKNGDIQKRIDNEEKMSLSVQLSHTKAAQFEKEFLYRAES